MTSEGEEAVYGYSPQSRHYFVSLPGDGTVEVERAALDSQYCPLPTFPCAPSARPILKQWPVCLQCRCYLAGQMNWNSV